MDFKIRSQVQVMGSTPRLPDSGRNAMDSLSEEQLLADALADQNKHDYTAATEKSIYLIDKYEGSDKAAYQLVEMLKSGLGVTEAFNYCGRADQEKSPAAKTILGHMYRYGYGVKKDIEKAVAYYQLGDKLGNGNAANSLGIMYRHGYGLKKDYNKAFACFQRGDERGNGYATYQLGRSYEDGTIVEKNDSTALDYYRKAADRGITAATSKILAMCIDGRAQKVDICFTACFLEKMAKEGSKSEKEKIRKDPAIRQELQKIREEEIDRIHSSYLLMRSPDNLINKNKTVHKPKTAVFTNVAAPRSSQEEAATLFHSEL
jgi:TPR repeat protein